MFHGFLTEKIQHVITLAFVSQSVTILLASGMLKSRVMSYNDYPHFPEVAQTKNLSRDLMAG